MAYENIRLERDGAVATLTVDRPKVLNALNRHTLDELAAAFDEVALDAGVRGLIVTGSGDKAFVAGADINELAKMQALEAKRVAAYGQFVFGKLERMSKP
jgi:enoyl-CoA hydratase